MTRNVPSVRESQGFLPTKVSLKIVRKEISKHMNKRRQTTFEYALFRGQIEPKPCLDWSPFSTGIPVIQLLNIFNMLESLPLSPLSFVQILLHLFPFARHG